MNRSQRRAAVISWAVTAAVLCGGVGAAPAQADPADANQSSAEVGGKPRARSQSPATRPDDAVADRRPAVRAAVRAPAGAPTHTDTAGETGEWPCHLPWLWPVPPEPVTSTRAMAAVPTVVPSPVLYPTFAERPLPGFAAEALAGIAASGPEVPQMLPPASPAGCPSTWAQARPLPTRGTAPSRGRAPTTRGSQRGQGKGDKRANRDRTSLEIAMQAPLLAGPADHQAAVQAQALGLPELAFMGNRWRR